MLIGFAERPWTDDQARLAQKLRRYESDGRDFNALSWRDGCCETKYRRVLPWPIIVLNVVPESVFRGVEQTYMILRLPPRSERQKDHPIVLFKRHRNLVNDKSCRLVPADIRPVWSLTCARMVTATERI